MVLYEIWSVGNKPFEELGPIEVTIKANNLIFEKLFSTGNTSY